MVLPQHCGCQDVTVPPQIRVWGILFCCYLLSALSASKTRSSRFHFHFWSFFLTQKSFMNHDPDVGEGRVIDWITILCTMDSPVFTSSFGTMRSACFGVLHASTSSRGVMNCVAHHDVYTGDGLLHFTPYAPFSSEDIHVWLPSQRYPSRCYVLHSDT